MSSHPKLSLRRNKKGVKGKQYTHKYIEIHGTPLKRIPLSFQHLSDVLTYLASTPRELRRELKKHYENGIHTANLLLVIKYRLNPRDPKSTRYMDIGKGNLETLQDQIRKLLDDTYVKYLNSANEQDSIQEPHNLFDLQETTIWVFPEHLGAGRAFDKYMLLEDAEGYRHMYVARASKTKKLCMLDCYAHWNGLSLKTVTKQYERSHMASPLEFVRNKCLTHDVSDGLFIEGYLNYYREGNHIGLVQKVQKDLELNGISYAPHDFKPQNMSPEELLLITLDFEFNMDPCVGMKYHASAPKIASITWTHWNLTPSKHTKYETSSYDTNDPLGNALSTLKILACMYPGIRKYCYSANGRGVEHQYLFKEICKTTDQNFYVRNIDGTKIKSFTYAGIYFIDSQLLFMGSLDHFCKSMGVASKLPIEEVMIAKGFWTPDQGPFMTHNQWGQGSDEKVDLEVEYCEQDTIGLMDALIQYNALLIEVHNLVGDKQLSPHVWLLSKPSLSSIASWILQHQWKVRLTPESIVPLIQESYYGGRTECWKLGGVAGEIQVMDINSSYPDVMREGICIDPILYTSCTPLMIQEFLAQGKHFLAYGVITHTSDLGKIAVKKDHKIIFPVGTFETHFWDHELYGLDRQLDPELHIVSVTFIITFDLDPCICGPLEKVYQKRLEVGKNTPLGTVMKLFMNNLYGRFGMKQERQFMGLIVDSVQFAKDHKQDLLYGEYVNEFRQLTIEGRQLCKCMCYCNAMDDDESTNVLDPDCICPCTCEPSQTEIDLWKSKINKQVQVNNLFAARTTSLGRYNLWKKLRSLKNQGCQLIYSDTDSIYFKCFTPMALENSNRLGEWDHDVIYDIHVRGLKVYGYNKTAKEITDPYVRDVIHYKGVRSPVNLQEKQISETWIRRDFDIYVVDMEKINSFEYTKGTVLKDGTVIPLVLER